MLCQATTALAAAPTLLQVGKARTLHTIAEAARAARDGDTVEIDAGDYVGDVAVWTQDHLTIRTVGGRAHLIANGAAAEGKGIWVVRGGDITVENIDFDGARVADQNGAGIRFERGHLTVRNCRFAGNENGILTGNSSGTLEVVDSEFRNNGTVSGQGHSIYVGQIAQLRISGTYIHHAVGGHLLKTRAAENHILANRLTDEAGGKASYELEFPNGGVNYVIGNIIEQSSETENSTIISMGGEGYHWPRNALYLVNNTIADDRPQGGVFVAVRPGAQAFQATNNLLVGLGKTDTGSAGNLLGDVGARLDLASMKTSARALAKQIVGGTPPPASPPALAGSMRNNHQVDWDQVMRAARYDYRLKPGSALIGKAEAPGSANGVELSQRLQFTEPHGTAPLGAGGLSVGAVQSTPR